MSRIAPALAVTFLLLHSTARHATAQSVPLTSAELADSGAMARALPRVADHVLAAYRDTSRVVYLDHTFRLHLVAGRAPDALEALRELQRRRAAQDSSPQVRARYVPFQIYLTARAAADRSGQTLAAHYRDAFDAVFAGLDDATAAFAARSVLVSARTAAADLRWAVPDQTNKETATISEALQLLHVYATVVAYRAFDGLPSALVAEDHARRYLVDAHVPVRTPAGATVCAVIVRARARPVRQPTLLQFTIYADSVVALRDATLAAAHGYVGVTGFTRGKACSPDVPVPYVHDGEDAAALIDWIAAQPWSDGRVGLFGGSYSGFTAWAAAKHMPKALKAMMVGAPAAPGVDVPMEGNIVQSFVYAWPFYTLNTRWLDDATYNDNARWRTLSRRWYATGARYRDMERIDGTANPGFAAWLEHPTLDAYWRATIPQGREYARITIPVLQTAGYFFGGPGGAAYYFEQHLRHNPRAAHHLLLGPYDHLQAQRCVVSALGDTSVFLAGYELDRVAQVDLIADLRFQWFDHVLNGGPKPALLADRVVYNLMGANAWRTAPSLSAMATDRLRVPLGRTRVLTVNLADRSDTAGPPRWPIDSTTGVVLRTDALPEGRDVSGLMTGHLEFVTNKRDFDLFVAPYEQTADGRYLSLPPYTMRASHVQSLRSRRLLVPGRPTVLDFTSSLRPMGRRIGRGSRIVIVLGVLKGAAQQINYGTGRDVSDESIADAGAPLRIEWLKGTYVDLPVRR